jgi:cell division transport system permease protein
MPRKPYVDISRLPKRPRGARPRNESPIVPADTIGGRALVAVVAIMTFLAALTTAGAVLIYASAGEWQSDVAREVTIQVRPAADRDIEADVGTTVEIARAAPGIAEVRPYTRAESARLLEPWLGTGLSLDDLPIPRVIVVRLASDASTDFAPLRKALSERVPVASLDDHRGWIDRMRTMARTAIMGAVALLGLMLAATIFSVTFATRGAMATNRPIIEVLHFIGARDAFISGQFQRHFLWLGLKGGAIGGAAAVILLLTAGWIRDFLLGSASAEQAAALFGSFSIGPSGYAAVLLQIVLIAVVTAWTSRQIVRQTLESMG